MTSSLEACRFYVYSRGEKADTMTLCYSIIWILPSVVQIKSHELDWLSPTCTQHHAAYFGLSMFHIHNHTQTQWLSVLANTSPAPYTCIESRPWTMLSKTDNHQNWPVDTITCTHLRDFHRNISSWHILLPMVMNTHRLTDQLTNHDMMVDRCSTWQPGFDLSCCSWSLCRPTIKWGLTPSLASIRSKYIVSDPWLLSNPFNAFSSVSLQPHYFPVPHLFLSRSGRWNLARRSGECWAQLHQWGDRQSPSHLCSDVDIANPHKPKSCSKFTNFELNFREGPSHWGPHFDWISVSIQTLRLMTVDKLLM